MAISSCSKCENMFEEGADGDVPPVCPKCYVATTATAVRVETVERKQRLMCSPRKCSRLYKCDHHAGGFQHTNGSKLNLKTNQHVDCDCMSCRPWTS